MVAVTPFPLLSSEWDGPRPERKSMLEDYERLVADLRRDRASWGAVEYRAGNGDDGMAFDLHERDRFGIILCLQYDRCDTDVELLRHVVTAVQRSAYTEGQQLP